MPKLTIDIEARFAQVIDAIDGVTKKIEKLGGTFDKVKSAAALFGVGLSGIALTRFIKGAIDAQDALNDLSKTTGVAIDQLGGLGFAAKQAGSDLEGVAQGMSKLNINIAKAAAGNEEAGAAFKAMGISIRDASGQIKSGDRVLLEIADKFKGYADGPNKAALAQNAFGKSFQSMIPVLDEGGRKLRENIEYWKQYSGVTKETAAQADEFNDELAKTSLHLQAIGNVLAREITPALLSSLEAFNRFEQQTGSLQTFAKGLAEALKVVVVLAANVAYVFEKMGEEIAGMAQQLDAIAHLDFSRFKQLRQEMLTRAEEDRKAIDAFSERVMHPERFAVPAAEPAKKAEAPGLPDPAAAKEALELRKKALDAQSKLLNDFVNEEGELLKARNTAAEGYYDEGLIAVHRFFDLQNETASDALNEQRRLLDLEQQAWHEFAADTSVPAKDRVEAMEKLNASIAKSVKLEQDAADATVRRYFAEGKAVQAGLDAITELNAQLQEQAGLTAAAAEQRRLVQNRQLRRFLEVNQPANVAQLDLLEQQQAAHDQLQQQLQETGRSMQQLGRKERSIADERLRGEKSTLEAMQAVDKARQEEAAALERQLPLLRERAALSGKPEDIEAVKEAEQALEDLAASANQVGLQMRSIFEQSLIDPMIEFVNHTKSADDALKGFFNSVAQGFLRIAAQQVSEKLFGGIFGLIGGVGTGTAGAGLAAAQAGTSSADLARYFGYAQGGIAGPGGVQTFARGGVTMRPHVAVFGEGSTSEAFVPLTSGKIPVSLSTPPEPRRIQAGPSAVTGRLEPQRSGSVTLQIHPDAMHMTLRDWFEGELARTAATR